MSVVSGSGSIEQMMKLVSIQAGSLQEMLSIGESRGVQLG